MENLPLRGRLSSRLGVNFGEAGGRGGRSQSQGGPWRGRGQYRGGRQNTNWRAGSRSEHSTPERHGHHNTSNDQRQRAHHLPRPERTMGFQYLEKLVQNDDIQKVILDLSNDRNGFTKLLESPDMSPDMIVLLVKLLRNVCSTSFGDVKINLLSAALHSRFMEKLTVFITSIISQTEQDKRKNKHFWKDPNEFWNCLIQFSKTVQELIPSNCEIIKKLIKNMTVFFPLIQEAHALIISDDIKAQTASLLDIVEQTMTNMEVKRQFLQNRIPMEEDMEPPDDFRQIQIIPSAQEVVAEKSPFLRANIVDKAFSSVNQYLDIQFRLLREDFVAPLRRGISTYLRNQSKPKKDWKKLDDIKIYKPIRFLNVETVNECSCYKICFDLTKQKRTFTYENSKRFMFGSLVCFTRDNFKSLLFGKIVQRDVQLLEQGLLIVGFQHDQQIHFDSDYLMVESGVYFEPYYQVLGVLQRMTDDSFPMKKYIIDVQTESHAPDYLYNEEEIIYEIEKTKFWWENFPSNRFFNLNDSQLAAFHAALTDEFCIVQGPPGTGKTYLGLRIAHTLLQNQHAWYKKTPILVICYTNHALDQFLEGLLPVTENILRVGGQSKNENLKKYNLAMRRRNVNHVGAVHQKRREVRDYMELLKTISDTLSQIERNDSILSFACFESVIENYSQTWFGTARNDEIRRWLLEGKQWDARARINARQAQAGMGTFQIDDGDAQQVPPDEPHPPGIDSEEDRRLNIESLDDIFSGIEARVHAPLLTLRQVREKLNSLYVQYDVVQQKNPNRLDTVLHLEKLHIEIWETETDLDYLAFQLEYFQDRRNRGRPQYPDLQHPFKMRYVERWQLYFQWVDQYARQLRLKYEDCAGNFRTIFRQYNDLRDIEDTQMMREHLVVGMTTTGAARLQSSLQALKSPIVIVEEAAEVLEAHIVASLTSNCKHLILIGDHLQLKPGAADYQIETKYKLGISLFERMVKNNIKCHTLNVQHRMRPEISRLIKPHIYPQLEDHESTLQRPPILGIEKCLYFIDHQEPEEMCQDASKKNIHESRFLIALARHLILNGYKPEQITILAAYLGQFFEMFREKNKPNNKLMLQDVRISVLDNYQGEECDIILLSLVRSNSDDKAGFLRIQNRACVALSRARDGFYIMGNMQLFLKADSENQIWDKVKAVLDEQNAIGTHLTLRCQVHPHRFTQVSKSEDFIKLSEGGCDLLCEAQIACGHICKRLCHAQDRDHAQYKCNEKCTRLLCNDADHVCRKLCYEKCGPCTYLVTKELDCGHTVNLSCHIDPAKFACKEMVTTKLPCDHETQKPCSDDLEKFRCPFPCDTRVEPCGHACKRTCHINMDPDHLEYKCQEPCAKPKVGCQQTEDHHICIRFCYQECEECNVGVKKVRSCGHASEIACKLDIEAEGCPKPCKKTLPCGHPCKSKCSNTCGPCKVMVEKEIPECLHTVKIKCHETPDRSDCTSKNCPRKLACGHKCTRSCSVSCTANCREIVDCSIQAPCGHTVKKIMCHLKNTDDPKLLLELCTEPCGAALKCGKEGDPHKCTGTCGTCTQGRIHKRCDTKCGVPLVCNHSCPIPCRQACKPCELPCGMRCRHSKCRKRCGEPCTPCKNPCKRRCEHVTCTKWCGLICNVPPCDQKCKKKLKCGHPCVGFCGDKCPPLCRICDHDELTTIFFGNEDEDDAIFVLLNDCQHVLEHTGLQQWLNQGDNEIQFKTCPRCKTNITTTERYSEYVKRANNDVISAKKKSFGEVHENENLRKKLMAELGTLAKKAKGYDLLKACPQLERAFDTLSIRLKPSRDKRRQTANKIELNAIQSKTQTLAYLLQCFNEVKKPASAVEAPAVVDNEDIDQVGLIDGINRLGLVLNRNTEQRRLVEHRRRLIEQGRITEARRLYQQRLLTPKIIYFRSSDACIGHLNMLLDVLLRSEDHVTDQEIADLELEIKRLHRIVQFDSIQKTDKFKSARTNAEVKKLEQDIVRVLFIDKRYSDFLDNALKNNLKELVTKVDCTVQITDQERMEIVKAMGFAKGHWYKCPKGHPYTIGDCGGANQVSRCFCGESIGGTGHRLLPNNQLAGEMDGATRHAWPGGLY